MGKIDENKRLKIEIIEEKCFFLNLIKNYKFNKSMNYKIIAGKYPKMGDNKNALHS
jgi:hypothetical protein